MAGPNPNALVLRFSPTSPKAVLERAERAFRESGRWLVSVWMDAAREGEGQDEVVRRLLEASAVGGIQAANNQKYYLCTSAKELTTRGFTFVKDGYDGEPELHCSVDIGTEPDLETAGRSLKPFTAARRTDAYQDRD